ISFLVGWLPWPWPLIPISIGGTLVGVFICGRVFVSNNDPLQTIGYSTPKLLAPREDLVEVLQPRTYFKSVESREHRSVSLEEIEQYYELKKLQPNLYSTSVDPEDIAAHYDEEGIIVAGNGP